MNNSDFEGLVKDIQEPPATPSDETVQWAANYLQAKGYDRRMPSNFDTAARYLAALRDGIQSKGLCLLGKVGVGKTAVARVIAKAALFRWWDSARLARVYQNDPEHFMEIVAGDIYGIDPLVIDDVGREPTVNDYGTRLEVMGEAISRRSAVYDRTGIQTIITSNLDIEDIVQRYGERTMSRIEGMCNIIVFEGGDQRQTGNDDYLGDAG